MTDRDERTIEEKREAVRERIGDVLEGSVDEQLLDFVSEDDATRDLVYDAERAVELTQMAAADYVFDAGALNERLDAALDDAVADNERSERSTETEDGEHAEPHGGPASSSAEQEEEASSSEEHESTAADEQDTKGTRRESGASAGASRPLLGDRLRSPRVWILAAAALAAAAAVLLVLRGPSSESRLGPDDAWSGKVQQISRAFSGGRGLELCAPDGSACESIDSGAGVPEGSVLRTDGRTRAMIDLGDGTRVVLDRATSFALDAKRPRAAMLEHGGLVAEVPPQDEAEVVFSVPLGRVEVLGTKLALRSGTDFATVDVSRGAVRLFDERERSVVVRAGEQGRLYADGPPSVAPASALGRAMSWGERAFEPEESGEAREMPGLGELRAKKPGEDDERRDAVTLASHSVKIRIAGNVARTEIEEVFENQTDDVLEGIFRFPLPPDAQIERLALDVDGKLEDGAFVDRSRAAKIWRGAIVNAGAKKPEVKDEIIWVPGPWRDPALLEWKRGGRFELRIYPIPKKGSRRIVLAYTQVIQPTGGVRRYTYPLPYDPSGSTEVDRFDVDVQVRGHDPAFGVRAFGYDLEPATGSARDVDRRSLTAKDFVPAGDLSIEYALENRDAELEAWAYEPGPDEDLGAPAAGPKSPPGATHAWDDQGRPAQLAPVKDNGGSAYVALALRPKLPRWAEDEHRSFALVVDASRSMYGERYRRATELAARVVREMDRYDEVTVLACDTVCREIGSGLGSPGPERAAEVTRFLEGITPEGGSDVTASIQFARDAASKRSGRPLRIVYIGDATPTVGPIQPAFVRREIERVLPEPDAMVVGVPLGADADTTSLDAIAEAGGGVVLPYAPGAHASDIAYAVLGAAYGTALSDVELDLPDGLVDVAPRRLGTLAAGDETIVVARMTRPSLSGTVRLRGKVGSEPFEQTYQLDLKATTAKGNAFVPRLYAAKTIADLEKETDHDSRERAVELSQRFNVASRYTSLLVLESPAMFKAFGLDNTRRTATWTGEEEGVSTSAEGDLEYAEVTGQAEKLESALDLGGFGSSATKGASGSVGYGSGAGALGGAPAPAARSRSAPKRKAAPKPRPRSAERTMDVPSGDFAPPPPRAAPEPRPPVLEQRGIPPADPLFRLPRRRVMIPMRRVWDRKGTIDPSENVPPTADTKAIAAAKETYDDNPESRSATRSLYSLYMLAGRLDDAARLAEHWSDKDPLDPEALTARADVAAARGERDLAIRILGSVVDVRPGDHKSQWRLARLHRWAGRPKMGCRHSMAVSQIRPDDPALLVEAVRCARDTGEPDLGDALLSAADKDTRTQTRHLLDKKPPDPDTLRGDLRLEGKWDGGQDLDLSILHPDGHRVSWLGAPTRSVITATDVLSPTREGLALRGAKPGYYVIEVSRATPGTAPAHGTVDLHVADKHQSLPFDLEGDRARLAVARIYMTSRLVRAR